MTEHRFAIDHGTGLELQRSGTWDRREFAKGAAALAASAGFLGYDLRAARAEPPPETTKIRLVRVPVICLAPVFVAEELLRIEGFSSVEYVDIPNTDDAMLLASGAADFGSIAVETVVPALDAGKPLVVLAGIHAGCLELFAKDGISGISGLKGKTVPTSAMRTSDHMFVASLAAYIGMDPERDINWIVTGTTAESMRLFVEGKVDAFLAGPPRAQDLRARKIGKVIVNTTHDRPWSQYFCCLAVANREFAEQHPVATKRALRALLKAADFCAQEPDRAAAFMVKNGYEKRLEVALEVLKDLPYRRWREANPEDSLRFFSLRLHEARMIQSSPQKIIAQGTDWRFLNELKKELKA